MNRSVRSVLNSLFLLSTLSVSMVSHAEPLTPCVSQTLTVKKRLAPISHYYTKQDGFLFYSYYGKYEPPTAKIQAYVDSLVEGVEYACQTGYEVKNCVPVADSCNYYKNVPEIWANVEGPVKDAGNYLIKEDEKTSCILNKRLDGTIDTSVADCMTPRQDPLYGNFSFFDEENRGHSSLGKFWTVNNYGSYTDYSKVYVGYVGRPQ